MTHGVGTLSIEVLSKQQKRPDFSCGVEALDRYLHERAGQDHRHNVAVPYVLVDTSTGTVIGFYTLSSRTILTQGLPPEVARKLPRYKELPAILLGRLAVDRRYQGQRFGEMLLWDALERALEISQQLGAMAVVVDAKDDQARAFYEAYGFARFVDDQYLLYMPIKSIAELRPSEVSVKSLGRQVP